jgi:hypothetical protein
MIYAKAEEPIPFNKYITGSLFFLSLPDSQEFLFKFTISPPSLSHSGGQH